VQIESSLVNALEEESEALQNITDQFAPLMANFRIFFFWEQEKTDLKYTKDYIVDETSAAPIIDNTERSGIAADHRGMCKFGKNTSQDFRTVVAALRRYGQEAPEVIKSRWVKTCQTLSENRRCEAMEMLRGVHPSSTHDHPLENLRRIDGWHAGAPALFNYGDEKTDQIAPILVTEF
jgi:protein SERAC1